MPSTTIRISPETLHSLRELAQQLGEPMQRILAHAVEGYRRHHLLERTNHAYDALRSDPEAWQEEEEERQAWDISLSDDLDEP